jgi:hypothetical protein
VLATVLATVLRVLTEVVLVVTVVAVWARATVARPELVADAIAEPEVTTDPNSPTT